MSSSYYELTQILQRCTLKDANFIINQIDSYFNFTDDSGLKKLRDEWDGRGTMPVSLAQKLEKEIRYLGSNDFAYLWRNMFSDGLAGVSVQEIIDDVSKEYKITIKAGSIEGRLENFTLGMMDKRIKNMTEEEQHELLKACGGTIDKKIEESVKNKLKQYGINYSPLLLVIMGSSSASVLVESVIIGILSSFIGVQAAKEMLKQFVGKSPILTTLGPWFIAGLTGWTLIDLAGAANRKLVPILLCLGMVCLRNGLEGA